jgi:hypothetical protein
MSDLLMRGRVFRLLAAAVVVTTFKVWFGDIAGIDEAAAS